MNITLDSNGLAINGKYWPLVSGEFEYWRHNPLYWSKILDLLIEAGLETVATFICWEFHEIQLGVFDFIGKTNPSRNLKGWLDLCKEKGLKVLLRIGPIHDAEWPSRGPALDVCTLERLDPIFLKRTRQYISAVAEVLKPQQITFGGPIIAFSLDNEVYFPYSTDEPVEPIPGYITVPYNEVLVMDLYRIWLKKKYGSIEKLNKSWEAKFENWSDISTPDYRTDSLPQILDSFHFMNEAMVRYFTELKAMCREAGLELPTYINTRQFTEYFDWPAIEKIVDSQGVNTYMGSCLPGDQGLVALWYYRLQLARRRLFWAPEFQCGVPVGTDELYGFLNKDHFRYFNQMAMGLGLRGANWYMFVERDDWHMSPINPVGKVRPQFLVMKENIRILKKLRPGKQVGDLGLLWFLSHNQAFMASKYKTWSDLQAIWMEFGTPKEFPAWWEAFRTLIEMDLDFKLIDPRIGNPSEYSVLIYAGLDYVEQDEWKKVYDAVENGAYLIAATPLPEKSSPSLETSDILQEQNAIMRVTGHVLEALPSSVGSQALQLGVHSYVTSRPAGLWSMAFHRDGVWTISVINPGNKSVNALLELSDKIVDDELKYQVTALVENREWTSNGKELKYLTVPLGAKSVEIYLISPFEK